MKRFNLPACAALLASAYLLFALCAMAIVSLGLPAWIERVLIVVASPGLFALAIWTPMLSPLGLTEGTFVVLPSWWGLLFVSALYVIFIYLAMRLVMHLIKR